VGGEVGGKVGVKVGGKVGGEIGVKVGGKVGGWEEYSRRSLRMPLVLDGILIKRK
jgi:hypothetical protein